MGTVAQRTREDRIRDWLILLTGLGGIAYETLWATNVSEALLILFASMIGLPTALAAAKKVTVNQETDEVAAQRDKALELLRKQNELMDDYKRLVDQQEKWSGLP